MTEIGALTDRILEFRDERDWAQFHTPSHLAAALAIEAAELQELMLWRSDDEIGEWLASGGDAEISRELADVMIFLLLLAHESGVDLERAVREKLSENREKYPVDLAKGNADKYTELGPASGPDSK